VNIVSSCHPLDDPCPLNGFRKRSLCLSAEAPATSSG
jgi:hypothetical protein